jgi:hypothetical protein
MPTQTKNEVLSYLVLLVIISPLEMIKRKFSKNKRFPELEIFLTELNVLKKYSEIELSISFYPYQRKVKADHFHLDPYEDYVADLVEGQRSTYQEIHDTSPQLFGIALGGAIFSYFLAFHSQLLISVESLVSIFAAYTVGKEIWQDIDVFLQDYTQSWRVRWVQQSFYYVLQQFGTLQRFWQLARKKRYGYQLTLPDEIDFISHSNSKTVEMLFKRKNLQPLNLQSLRILRIVFDQKVPALQVPVNGFLICRVALIQKFLGFRWVTEYYQGADATQMGTLDTQDHWHTDKSLEKRFFTFGRLVYYLQQPRLVEKKIIDQK